MLTVKQALAQQLVLRKRVLTEDCLSWPVKIIAGADVEYDKHSNLVAAAIVLLDAATCDLIEVATHVSTVSFPYIPGLFSFREMPPLVEAYKKLHQKPDVVICDGHGIAHPRRFGLACHLGVELDIPTIGCAKSLLIGSYSGLAFHRGATSPLVEAESGDIVGMALRTQLQINPLFVSIGHRISLSKAIETVLMMSREVRLPETTRQADRYAREALIAGVNSQEI